MLPASALGLLAFRTFRGEQVREEYQRRERQQQILRLLESDLINWVLSQRESAQGKTLVLAVRQDRVFLPRLNVYLSPGHLREVQFRTSSRDSALWRDAQSIELLSGNTAMAVEHYKGLLSGNEASSSWARLALLRLALQGAASTEAAVWLSEIQEKDQAAVTESGTPVWVGAALILVEHRDDGLTREAAGFLAHTLSQLAGGRWHLNAAQWIYYARQICRSLDSKRDLRSGTLATAAFLESLAGALGDVLALNQSLGWRRDQPFAACRLAGTESVVVLFPGEDRNTGYVLSSTGLRREAETRLNALTVAEDFQGRVGIAGDNRQPEAAFLSAFPFLGVSFAERDQGLWRSHLRRYTLFYAATLLLIGAGTGLFFTYRAVAREIEVSRLKAEFVSSVSHEFRTPLSAIEALLERLESGKVRDEEMLHRYYQASRREVQRLTAMVNQLLDFSRLKEGREEFSFQTINLNLLAEEAIQSFRNLGFGARLVDGLDREEPLNVSADKDAAFQCIHNLIDNSLKYSPNGSQVTIASGRREGEVLLRVSDRGPGIAPEDRELIFEQFYRAKTADGQGIRGAGIGLALVKRVMQAHGGKVTLESRMGEGSTFQLAFPEVRS